MPSSGPSHPRHGTLRNCNEKKHVKVGPMPALTNRKAALPVLLSHSTMHLRCCGPSRCWVCLIGPEKLMDHCVGQLQSHLMNLMKRGLGAAPASNERPGTPRVPRSQQHPTPLLRGALTDALPCQHMADWTKRCRKAANSDWQNLRNTRQQVRTKRMTS